MVAFRVSRDHKSDVVKYALASCRGGFRELKQAHSYGPDLCDRLVKILNEGGALDGSVKS